MESKSESKYERLRKIGIGSYGVVFKCVNRLTGQIVAIKRYSENDSDPIIRKIAMREVRMLRQLRHPNLIHLIEVFRRKRRLHLVFDYCELTVLDVIEKYANNCPMNLIRKIIWQLVNGVSHCHLHNCIHRDIKPENILINQAGVVKLCDFGFARSLNSKARLMMHAQSTLGTGQQRQQLEREEQQLGAPSNRWPNGDSQQLYSADGKENSPPSKQADQESVRQALTEYVATRWYRAPELLVGEIYYDTKIDIWAIGCVTAELMRGEPLWPGKTDLDQLSMIKSSLGALTSSQAHTLVMQNLYDQINTERILEQPAGGPVVEPLERRLPARVGQAGVDFVLLCLQMDPLRRPNCERLLQHSYIQSARMTQFVRGATGHSSAQVAAAGAPTSQPVAERQRTTATADSTGSTASSSNLSGAPLSSSGGASSSLIPKPGEYRSNSQHTLLVASQQPAIATPSIKRPVLAVDAAAHQNASVLIPVGKKQSENCSPKDEQLPNRVYKRKLPSVVAKAETLSPIKNMNAQTVRMDRDLHQQHKAKVGTAKPVQAKADLANRRGQQQVVVGATRSTTHRKMSVSNCSLFDSNNQQQPIARNQTMLQKTSGTKAFTNDNTRYRTQTRKTQQINSPTTSGGSQGTNHSKSSSTSFLPTVSLH